MNLDWDQFEDGGEEEYLEGEAEMNVDVPEEGDG